MTIRDWVNNPSDFNEGLKLYEKYGVHGNLKRILAKAGDTARNRKTLVYELTKIVGKDEVQPKPEPVRLAPTVKPVPPKKIIEVPGNEPMIIYNSEEEANQLQRPAEIMREVDKPNLAALDKQWKDLFKKANHIKSQLSHYRTKKERSDACGQILSIMDECDKIWRKIDHFKEHGSIPEETNIQVQDLNDPISLMKRRMNLKTYISAGKNNKKQSYTPEKIAAFEKELEQIEEKLKTMIV